jgi:hypothetical protein
MCNIVILGITKTKADKPNKRGIEERFCVSRAGIK